MHTLHTWHCIHFFFIRIFSTMSTRASHGKIQSNNQASIVLASLGNSELKPAKANQPALPIWDELKKIYQQCNQGLMIYAGIKDMQGRTDLFKAMTPAQRETYVCLAARLANDLGAYDRDLQTIYALHSHKSGTETNIDAAKQWIQITEQYENFRIQAESVLNQTYLQLVEVVKEAEQQLAAQHDPSNPNIITDVVVTEIGEEVASS